jgi:hypothetical protein
LAAQATADVVGLQLEQVRDKLPELFHYNDVFWNRIDTRKDVIKVSSRATRIPLQIRPGSKYGLVNLAGGVLGRGTATHYDHADLTPLASRVAIEINQDALDQTDGEPKAIRKLLALEIKNAMREFRTQLNVQVQLAGDNIIATTSQGQIATDTSLTVAVTPFYSQLVRAGQILTIYDTTVTTNRGTVTVSSVDYANHVINVVGTIGFVVTSGDVVLLEGVSGANPVGYFGIRYHHSDANTGTWLTMSRATNPEVRANAVHNSSNALTTAPIRLILNKILQRVGQVNPKQLLAHLHPAQRAAYEELAILISDIAKGSGNEAVDMLFGDIKLAGVPAMVDIHAARDRIDFVNLDTWGKVESSPVDFLKLPDGRYFDRPVDSATGSQVAAVIFWIYWYGQFFIDNPAAVGYIDSLAIPAGYTTGL